MWKQCFCISLGRKEAVFDEYHNDINVVKATVELTKFDMKNRIAIIHSLSHNADLIYY